jgi:hypothetical protein
MRAIVIAVALDAAWVGGACRFDPTGGVAQPDDGGAVDAAPIDGAPTVDAAVIVDAAIDARVIDAPPAACPGSYNVAHLGSRYRFEVVAAQHAQARLACENDLPGRTHLATFELVDMTAAIDAIDPGASATPWVGAVCAPNLDCNFKASWFWLSGLPVSSNDWAPTQPDNGATEKVARVERGLSGGNKWELVNVGATAFTLPFICECDPF